MCLVVEGGGVVMFVWCCGGGCCFIIFFNFYFYLTVLFVASIVCSLERQTSIRNLSLGRLFPQQQPLLFLSKSCTLQPLKLHQICISLPVSSILAGKVA